MPSNGGKPDAPEITVTKLMGVTESDAVTKEKEDFLRVLNELAGRLEHELKAVLSFWDNNSLDEEHNGYLTCVDYDGTIYDTTKYCELQAQQTYIYAKLYNCTDVYHTEDMLSAAKLGGEFLLRHAFRTTDSRCYYSVTREGKPIQVRPNMNTEVHFVMALFELHYATKQANYLARAEAALRVVLAWIKDSGTLNQYGLETTHSTLTDLGHVFRMLLAISEHNPAKLRQHKEDFAYLVKRILQHVQRKDSVVLETVQSTGEVEGSMGRLVVPGVVLELGWMLLKYSLIAHKKELRKQVLSVFVEQTFAAAWDPNNGGIFSFLDADGLSPTELAWNMKLWWPVTEAMISLLMSYKVTGERKFLNDFSRVFDYAMVHFREPGHGEWYGYLDNEGRVTHTFKGGPQKGCFHVARCLWMCARLVRDVVSAGGVEK